MDHINKMQYFNYHSGIGMAGLLLGMPTMPYPVYFDLYSKKIKQNYLTFGKPGKGVKTNASNQISGNEFPEKQP